MRIYEALAFIVVASLALCAQPIQPRKGKWVGTNGNQILYICENNEDTGRGPVLSGCLRLPDGVFPLVSVSFDYRDNTFRARYVVLRKTNDLRVRYVSGTETNVKAEWDGKIVNFHPR